MKDVIKVLDWFDPSMTVEAVKKSVMVYSNEKLLNCFEVFRSDLTVEQIRNILKEMSNMDFKKSNKPTTKTKTTTTGNKKVKFTEEMDTIIKKEHGNKTTKEIADIIKNQTGETVHLDKINARAYYIKNR